MMKTWKENYGADADGNRGVSMDMYELEFTEEENEDIADILYEIGTDSDSVGIIEIEYQGLTIEVDASDYSTIIKEKEDRDENTI